MVVSKAPFDELAKEYDSSFSHTILGRLLRDRVWEILAALTIPGQRILELNSGTGEDALWMIQRGCAVVVSDQSTDMLSIARNKVSSKAGVSRVQFIQLDLEHPEDSGVDGTFDGVLSNFGGLNMVGDLYPLTRFLSRVVNPGGFVVLTVMGRFCPWEICWHLIHGRGRKAFRRLTKTPVAQLGKMTVAVHYPSHRHLQKLMTPTFETIGIVGIGLLVPPSYTAHVAEKFPKVLQVLNGIERLIQTWTASVSDHYILVLRKSVVG